MAESQTKIALSPAEKQILEHPDTLKAFLYVLVPALAGFNVYVMLTGRWWACAVLTLQLAGFITLLGVMRSQMPDIRKILAYRHMLRLQILVFGIYILIMVGMFHQIEVTPWAFLYIFLVSLWMPDRWGVRTALVFISGLLMLIFWTDPGFFFDNKAYMVRFFFALIVFSLLALSAAMVRRRYLANLFAARSRLERSESKHRRLAEKLRQEIDHRDRIEKRLHHAIKMEAVGRVAAGVAHDLNNILSGIVTYPELLLLDLEEDDPMYAPLDTIRRSGIRAAAIVEDLLTLSRRGVAVSTPVDLREMVAEFLSSPEAARLREAHPQVRVSVRYEQGETRIMGSPVHLAKTMVNLVSNGVESISGKGEVAIYVRPERLEAAEPLNIQVQGVREIPAGDYVVVSVSDTGAGIDPQDMDSVFEPFYTKKQMGRSGTGLGMSLILESVNDHNGFICLASTPGAGTTISLFFPPAKEVDSLEPASGGVDILAREKRRILVVDDEPAQRLIAQELLTRLGYQVSCAASGEEALARLQTETPDLIIMDIIMDPGMSGVSTCEKILAAHPSQKVIFATGFSDNLTLDRARSLGPCLYKPYSIEQIGALVKDRLNS